jgi:hypothetical protein
MIPEQLKTTTEKIAWLDDNIRTQLELLETLNKQKIMTEEKIAIYEKMIRVVLKKEKRKEDEQT